MKTREKSSYGTASIQLRRNMVGLLAKNGFKNIKERSGQGVRPAARFTAESPDGSSVEIAVRIGSNRAIGMTRMTNGHFRTFDKVHLVLAIVPDQQRAADFEVFAFDSQTLKGRYGQALDEMKKAGLAPELDVPV